jgi:NhaA family Na+:H+ antiporter
MACWIAVRFRAARLPGDLGWPHVVGVAAAAGVPFTVSLFIGEIALGGGPLLRAAKLGILAAAVLAGFAGFLLLRRAERGWASGAAHGV